MARRHGVTLIATVLHCTSLQEIYSAEKLLNWGFAMVNRVRPVGTLVAPLPPAPSRLAHKRVTKPHGSANSNGSLATGASTSHTAAVAIGGTIATVLCVGLVSFILLRRRATAAK